MRIGAVVLKLRIAKTIFGNYIGGAAEMQTARQNTLNRDSCFVVPLG